MCLPQEKHIFTVRSTGHPPAVQHQNEDHQHDSENITNAFIIEILIGFMIVFAFHVWIMFLLYLLYRH